MTTAGNLSQAPNVTFEITNPSRTLGPGGISMVPVWVTIPEDIPARERFELVFDWASTGDETISDQANITIEARPDHRWDIQVQEGYQLDVLPRQEMDLTIDITNIGNSDDLLTITPEFTITRSGNDNSVWSAESVNSSRLNVDESETLSLTFDIPANTWAGTSVNLALETSSSDFVIDYAVNISLNVIQVSEWGIDLSNTSLEVPPNGGELELTIEQRGNFPDTPYFTKAGQGWNVSLPNSGDEIELVTLTQ